MRRPPLVDKADLPMLREIQVYSLDFRILEILDVIGRLYYAKHSNVLSLVAIFADKSEEFFNMFSGMSIRLPRENEESSHVPEIEANFGRDIVEELYRRYGRGATIKVPTAQSVNDLLIDLVLYCNVRDFKGEKIRAHVKSLSEKYGVPTAKVKMAYKKVSGGARS